MIKGTTKRKNRDWINPYRDEAGESRRWECALGFPKGEESLGNPHYTRMAADGTVVPGSSILEVAIYNNYDEPQRPFMEKSTPDIEAAWKETSGTVFAKARAAGKTVDVKATLELAGVEGAGIIQNTISTGNWVPNSPITIARKGSSQPLIDSGDMRRAVTHRVRERSV